MNKFFLITILLFAWLGGCATSPEFDTTGVDNSLTPQSVIAEPANSKGKMAIWGGSILSTRNLETTTQIEVLAYPLNASHKPMLDSTPLGRFIIEHKGYLEPATYKKGLSISVLGEVSKVQKGKVGESDYTYPVLSARKIYLWVPGNDPQTSFHFGIGVRL